MLGDVCREAEALVTGDRAREHGNAALTYQITADMWTAYIGKPVAPKDVVALMILLKVARDKCGSGTDNPVDIAGYADLLRELTDV